MVLTIETTENTVYTNLTSSKHQRYSGPTQAAGALGKRGEAGMAGDREGREEGCTHHKARAQNSKYNEPAERGIESNEIKARQVYNIIIITTRMYV